MKYSDKAIINEIRTNGAVAEGVLAFLYKNKNWQRAIFSMVKKSGGTEEDAEDIFQEGMRRMVVNIQHNDFEGRSTLKTYHFRICRNLWTSQLRQNNRHKELQVSLKNTASQLDPEKMFQLKEQKEQINKLLHKLDDNCRQVLLFWARGYSMKEIAKEMGYKNEQVAKNRKCDCLKKLVRKVKNNPQLVKILREL